VKRTPVTPQIRARRSRYVRRRRPSVKALVLSCMLSVLIVGSGYVGVQAWRVWHSVSSSLRETSSPLKIVQEQLVGPEPGTIAWKLNHRERVNILLLGYGGPGEDGPYLTDTMIAVSIDPASQRIFQISVPRDAYVRIDAWKDGRQFSEKLNAAFAVPHQATLYAPGPLKAEYQGRDGPAHLAETIVSQMTGLTFDRYAALDFEAFRAGVDALGGVQVCLDTPLDDYEWQVSATKKGVHFPAGCQQLNGEQALELARSRRAIQPEQSTDYGRSKRQQLLINAMRKKATSGNVLTTVPNLMESLQGHFATDLSLLEIKALYDFGSGLPETAMQRFSITGQDLVHDYSPNAAGSCGPRELFVSCPEDPTYRMWHAIFSRLFVDRSVLDEKAPVQLVNASASPDLQVRTSNVLRGLGYPVSDGVRGKSSPRTVVYDYSGGRFPRTEAWLRNFFGADAVAVSNVTGTNTGPASAFQQATQGLAVIMGSDFAKRWYGEA
jgi:LCP family protein required for cell wall assembly